MKTFFSLRGVTKKCIRVTLLCELKVYFCVDVKMKKKYKKTTLCRNFAVTTYYFQVSVLNEGLCFFPFFIDISVSHVDIFSVLL